MCGVERVFIHQTSFPVMFMEKLKTISGDKSLLQPVARDVQHSLNAVLSGPLQGTVQG